MLSTKSDELVFSHVYVVQFMTADFISIPLVLMTMVLVFTIRAIHIQSDFKGDN